MVSRVSKQARVAATAASVTVLAVLATQSMAMGSDDDPRPSGAGQSPIDIRADGVIEVDRLAMLKPRLRSPDVLLHNTGSPGVEATVQIRPQNEGPGTTVGDKRYELLQVHFHTSSEHLLDGKRFPMEMHAVHQAADGEFMVVGTFIREGRRNRVLTEVFANLPEESETDYRVEDLRLDKLLPRNLASYRYNGSLTTAPYTEGLRWIVLDQEIEASTEQIEAFRLLFPDDNAREAQEIGHRTVLTDVDDLRDDDDHRRRTGDWRASLR